ncbi:molybdenum cofactor guanylyltransferase [Sphingobium aromaticiconvertens]|uniref:molybdenum cofactor guanylyltransferase n=1 Tax=Sphingobium aromaticiconvertens TaxID=365341 RepID=UPI00301A69BE
MSRFLGAVLAGGRSTRFGSDKAEAVLEGRRLLDHAIHALGQHVDEVVLCGRTVEGMVCLPDRPAPDLGPLGGINASLRHAREHGFSAVITTGCDMPNFPKELFDALVGQGPAVLEGQHLAGFWPSLLADRLDQHLTQASNRSLFAWFEQISPRFVTVPDLVMPNINRVGDLEVLAKERRGHAQE